MAMIDIRKSTDNSCTWINESQNMQISAQCDCCKLWIKAFFISGTCFTSEAKFCRRLSYACTVKTCTFQKHTVTLLCNLRAFTFPLTITYALFKGNIAYLGIDGFSLSPYLYPAFRNYAFPNPSEEVQTVIDKVVDTWTKWFEAIQIHHNVGDLGGVIIDVRSNRGGLLNDYQYVIGALLPSGDFQVCNGRFKRGVGRYD